MKKVLVLLFVLFAHTAFAQKSINDMKFVKIDSAVHINRFEVMQINVLYPAPDSVAIDSAHVTMFFFAANVKTTVSKKTCEKYLQNSEAMLDLRIKFRLAEIRSKERMRQDSQSGSGAAGGTWMQ